LLEVKIAAESLRFLLSPLLQEYEVDRLREVVASDSPCETQKLLELAHAAAFRDQGNSSLVSFIHSFSFRMFLSYFLFS
jgi:hypothetical protein